MDWQTVAAQNLKRKNQVLFAKDSAFLQQLHADVAAQPRTVQVLWALAMAEDAVDRLETLLPGVPAPRAALERTREWAAGQIKMPVAKRAILDCHAVAKSTQNAEAIALCHAVGQALSVVHTVGHVRGFPLYDLTALIRRYGLENAAPHVQERMRWYYTVLGYWQTHAQDEPRTWAAFLL